MTYVSPELLDTPAMRAALGEYHEERDRSATGGVIPPAQKPHLVIAAQAPQANGKPAKRPKPVSARELLAMEFEPVKYVVPGYVAEGATILAGRPKLGKSWMALEMAVAVATGGTCLGGIQCEQGDVLYLALEDNRRRLQSRLDRILPAGSPGPENLAFETEWPRANEGGLKYLREWLDEHPAARLVVVDILTMFRDVRNGKDTPYESDYAAVKGLQSLAMEKGFAVLIVHHTRKSSGEGGDAFEKVSGTLGLSGAADTTIVLDRDGNGATLYGRGRDIEEIETAVRFDRDICRWSVLGQASEVRKTDERKEILDALKEADGPMSPADLVAATGMTSLNIRQLLFKMAKAGEVLKVGRGRYIHPDRTDLDNNADNNPRTEQEEGNGDVIASTSTHDNNDNKVTSVEKHHKNQTFIDASASYRCDAPITTDNDGEGEAHG